MPGRSADNVSRQRGWRSEAQLPSDGTISCSACKKPISAGESYFVVDLGAAEVHPSIRGGNLHEGCADALAQPADMEAYGASMLEYVRNVRDVAESLGGVHGIDAWREGAGHAMASLDSLVAGIVGSFEGSIDAYSYVGAHADIADMAMMANGLAEKAARMLGEVSMVLEGANDVPNGDMELLLRAVHCLVANATDLKVFAPRLMMLSAAERYLSGDGAIGEADRTLKMAVNRFSALFRSGDGSALITEECVNALRRMTRNALEAHGGRGATGAEIRDVLKMLVLEMKSWLRASPRMADPGYALGDRTVESILRVYTAMLDLFALLDMPSERTEYFAAIVGIRTMLSTKLLEDAKRWLHGPHAPGSAPAPQGRQRALLAAGDALRHLQALQGLWNDGLLRRDAGGTKSTSAAPFYGTLIAECRNIMDEAAPGANLRIRDGHE